MGRMKTRLNRRELQAWRAFIQLTEVIRARIDQQLQSDCGLSSADYAVLGALTEVPDGRMRVYELSHELGWDKTRLHHQLKRMADRGLVDRERCGSRGINAVISDHGRRTIQDAAPSHAQEVRRLFADRLTPAQIEAFGDISRTLLDSLLADDAQT
jgi:DNA-binding MarR family transcriptional regulator